MEQRSDSTVQAVMLNLARDKTSPLENAMALKIKLIRLSQPTSIDPPRSLTQQDCLSLKSFNKKSRAAGQDKGRRSLQGGSQATDQELNLRTEEKKQKC